LRTGIGEVRAELGEVRAGLGEVRTSLGDLRADVQNLRAGHERLVQRIGVLHEETLDSIAALAPDDRPIRRG
jgi:hypothetical protein